MSSTQQGPDWWLASDGRWYPPPGSSPASDSWPSPRQEQPRQTKAREKLLNEARAWLEPGEQLTGAFVGQTGPPGIGTWGPGALLQRYWAVACTDQGVLIGPLGMKGSPERMPWHSFAMPNVRPRGSTFDVTIGTRTVRVSTEQFDEVASVTARCREAAPVAPAGTEAANQEESGPQPAAEWFADPTRRHQLRYWDGVQWTSHVADAGVQGDDPVTSAPTDQRAI